MHCNLEKNYCLGIGNCFCECERCLEADDLASAPADEEDHD